MKLKEIARAIGCELEGDGEVEILDVASIEDAPPGTLTFLAERRHQGLLAGTRAAAVVVAPDAPELAIPSLRATHPQLAFAAAVELFHPFARPAPRADPTAVIAPTATLGPNASIGAHAVVGEGVTIGRDAVLHPNVTIYPDVRIGDGFTAHAGAVVREGVRIGDRVTLHAGAVIGSDGFGYLPLPDGARRIPQIGTVVLEDDVEIGANATVDRAALGATVVGRGTKVDNLVMIAHGCRIGPHCLIAGQVGLAGSTRVGSRVMMGGQVGVAGHLEIGDGAQLSARAAVHQAVPAGQIMGGYPAVEIRRWRRMMACLASLPDALRRLRRVERTLGLRGGDEE